MVGEVIWDEYIHGWSIVRQKSIRLRVEKRYSEMVCLLPE